MLSLNQFLLGNDGQKAYGIVILVCGGHTNTSNSNVFICEKDDYLYLDDVSKKPLNKIEKPSSLCSKLIQKYTNTVDWILDGCGGIGKYII